MSQKKEPLTAVQMVLRAVCSVFALGITHYSCSPVQNYLSNRIFRFFTPMGLIITSSSSHSLCYILYSSSQAQMIQFQWDMVSKEPTAVIRLWVVEVREGHLDTLLNPAIWRCIGNISSIGQACTTSEDPNDVTIGVSNNRPGISMGREGAI